jgi:isoquinoline 1-oxidoreductase beta subunit
VNTVKVNRRGFLKTGAAVSGGLVLGFAIPQPGAAQNGSAKLNAYIQIAPDDTVAFAIVKGEMGQGTVTSLSQILAEELDCDWKKIKTYFPGADPAYGPMQGVFGSLSVRTMYTPLRQASAQARDMLVTAAAQRWGVNKSQCRTENGAVINTATNARLTYGSIAEAAAKLPVPQGVSPKDPKTFKLIGTSPKRLDTTIKVNGQAKFGIDARVDGMVYAVLAQSPVFGGKVKSFDASKAKAVPGVKQVIQVPSGIAVIAEDTWSALEGRKALEIVWDEGKLANLTSAAITKSFADSMSKDGAVARKVGDAVGEIAKASRKIEAVYEAPFLSHAPMEPMNCTALVNNGKCDVWVSTQMTTGSRDVAMEAAGLKAEDINLHLQYMGGGFGRRGGPDFVGQAVEIAKALPGTPVKLTWSREDDMQHDLYRPASYTRFQAVLGADGYPTAIHSRIACPPFGPERDGVAGVAVEGVQDMHYQVPNLLVDYHRIDPGIPVSYWRSVGYSQNTFFTEAFIDELAAEAKKDPLEYRRKLLSGQRSARLLGALEMAADKFGWSKQLPSGHGKGIGIVANIGSFTAMVAEASLAGNKLKVHRVVCAVDCGVAVNPAIIEQQIQSGIVYGLAAALKGAITIDKGRVQQGNFNSYDVLRMDEMPVVEVHVVPSSAAPGGIGEASTPPIAPAVANAIFNATGKRFRKLPFRVGELA